MSIIHEALKKADGKKQVQPPRASSQRVPPYGRLNGGLLFVVTVLLVFGAFLLAPLSRGLKNTSQPASPNFMPNAVTVMQSSSGANQQFGVEEMPLPGAFALSGVVISSDHSFGIINGQIVEAGQQVSGATVRSITGREVALDYNGQKIILPVSDRNTL